MHVALGNLAAGGATAYFDNHLKPGYPTLPSNLSAFVDYFSRPDTPNHRLQKHFTQFISKKQYDEVFQSTEGKVLDRARLNANQAPGASCILTIVPTQDRFVLKDTELGHGFALRLGIPAVATHPGLSTLRCAKCGVSLLHDLGHAVNCDKQERTSMHDEVKTTGIHRNAMACGLASKVEPSRLHPHDNKRRVDVSIAFPDGRKLVDVSIIDTLCATHVHATATEPHGAVLRKERQKIQHHAGTALRFGMEIVPFIVDLHGSHGPDARKLLRLMAEHCPRPRLFGQNPKTMIIEEMAASGVAILRVCARVTRLAYADAHSAMGLVGVGVG